MKPRWSQQHATGRTPSNGRGRAARLQQVCFIVVRMSHPIKSGARFSSVLPGIPTSPCSVLHPGDRPSWVNCGILLARWWREPPSRPPRAVDLNHGSGIRPQSGLQIADAIVDPLSRYRAPKQSLLFLPMSCGHMLRTTAVMLPMTTWSAMCCATSACIAASPLSSGNHRRVCPKSTADKHPAELCGARRNPLVGAQKPANLPARSVFLTGKCDQSSGLMAV